jgi:hypothetical protein
VHLDVSYPVGGGFAYSQIDFDPANGGVQQQYDVYASGGYQLTVYDTQGNQPWSRWVAQIDTQGNVAKQIYWDAASQYVETDQTLRFGATTPSVQTNISASGARVTEVFGAA